MPETADTVYGGSAAERLCVGGSKSIASFFMRNHKLCPPRGIGILNENNSPTGNDAVVLLHFTCKLQLIEPRAKLITDFISFLCIHPMRWQSEAPIQAIDTQVGRLNRIGHIRGDEERRRDDPCGPIAARACLREVCFELTDEFAIGGLLDFIHHEQAVFLLRFKEIEKPFLQKNMILSKKIFDMWLFRFFDG